MLALQQSFVSPARKRYAQLVSELEDRYGANTRVLDPGHWAFEVLTRDGRSQVVHVMLLEERAIERDTSRVVVTSPIGPLPPRLDFEGLLRRNADLDVGAICIEELRMETGEQAPYLTLRASHLIGTADFEEIWEMVEKVARVADQLERDIFARDQF